MSEPKDCSCHLPAEPHNTWQHDSEPDWMLWSEDAAELIGVTPGVFRKMRKDASRARERGELTTKHLPQPDELTSRTVSQIGGRDMTITKAPRWQASTLRAWLEQRPGRGRPGKPIGETKT